MRKALASVGCAESINPLASCRRWTASISRPDGNNVSMDREGLNLAEAQLKFKTGVALMRLENQRVMDAIHADK